MFGSNETYGSIAVLGFVLLDRELAFPSEKQVLCSLKVKRFYSCDWTKLPKRGIIYSVCLGYKKLSASPGLILMAQRFWHIQPLTALLFLICWVTGFFWLVGLQSATLCLLICVMILFLLVRPRVVCLYMLYKTQDKLWINTWINLSAVGLQDPVIPQTVSAIFLVKSGIEMLLQHINLT